ncbi:hypothetical protein EMCRGX_G011372 [Ephydatia muelleri]
MSADANKRKRKPTMKMVESECEEVVLDQSKDIPTTSKQKRPKQATKIPSPTPIDDNTTIDQDNAKGSSLLDDRVSRRDILLKTASAGSGGEKNENSPEGTLMNLKAFPLTSKTGSNEIIVNGTNVLIIPSKNPYTFGLNLLDIKGGTLYVTTVLQQQRVTASLDQAKVSRIIEIINKRYQPGDWDMKTFITKANQKCRDSKP